MFISRHVGSRGAAFGGDSLGRGGEMDVQWKVLMFGISVLCRISVSKFKGGCTNSDLVTCVGLPYRYTRVIISSVAAIGGEFSRFMNSVYRSRLWILVS